jgi:hypothetical protein
MSFEDAALMIKELLKSQTIPELIRETKQALLNIFQCKRVNFLFMDKEAATIFNQEGGKTEPLLHAHFLFDYAVPEV